MTKKRRPLSCSVWNLPWPPKYMTGSPRPPVKPDPPLDPPPDEPILPPARENWLALVLGASVMVLFAVAMIGSGNGLLPLPIVMYAGVLTWTAWWVRPRPGRGLVFFWWFLPILLQLSLYLLLAWEAASEIVQGPRWGPYSEALLLTCFIAMWVGWVPSIGLLLSARRGGGLLAAQTVGPLVAFVATMLLASPFD